MAEEPEPFADLYREHRGVVYRFFRRELGRAEAEDATQTAFAQAFGAYVRGTRPERPRAWLLTIAENLRRSGFRRRRLAGEAVPLDEEVTPARDPDERVEGLREALEALPLNQRAALVLREVAGLSYAEIGRSLRLSVGSVQMLLFRARRSMREELVTSRRALTTLPPWLANLVPSADRLAVPLRAAGAAAAVATAAIVVTGADPATTRPSEPAAPSVQRDAGPASPPAIAEPAPVVVAEPVVPTSRGAPAHPRQTVPTSVHPTTVERPAVVETERAPASAPAAGVELPEAVVGALPLTPASPAAPALPTPPPLPLPEPVPIPSLPDVDEGALVPQLDTTS